jgi:RNA polymerase sigma factor (sigma-70 family)
MPPGAPTVGGTTDLAAVVAAVRRVVGARVADPATADDLVQEALLRTVAHRPDLDGDALLAYAVVVAGNVVRSHGRTDRRHRRLEPRLVDPRTPEPPDDVAVRREADEAVLRALDRLPAAERHLLVARDVEGARAADLAADAGTSAGAMGVRLSRLRARMRVEFVLALRGVEPPTPACRPVLEALSAGDRRRQHALGAGAHLRTCDVCASAAEPLLTRQRALAGAWPLLPLVEPAAWLRRTWRAHPAPAAAATTGVVVAAAMAAAVSLAPVDPAPRPTPTAPVTPTAPAVPEAPAATLAPAPPPTACGGDVLLAGRPVGIGDGPALAAGAGQPVAVRSVPVADVVADEGFWLGCDEGRVWVQMVVGSESAVAVTTGAVLSLEGALAAHGAGFADAVGAGPVDGAALDGAGVHIEAPAAAIRIDGP